MEYTEKADLLEDSIEGIRNPIIRNLLDRNYNSANQENNYVEYSKCRTGFIK